MRNGFEVGKVSQINIGGNFAVLTTEHGKKLQFNGDELIEGLIMRLALGQTVYFEREVLHGPYPRAMQVRTVEPMPAKDAAADGAKREAGQ